MRKLQIAALLCVAFVLMSGCTSNKVQQEGAKAGVKKLVTIDGNCAASTPNEPNGRVTISKKRGDHVRWTASAGYKFRVTFKQTSPCHKSAAPDSPSVPSYDVVSGAESDQCFALQATPTGTYDYKIEDTTNGPPRLCADPAVIVEN